MGTGAQHKMDINEASIILNSPPTTAFRSSQELYPQKEVCGPEENLASSCLST